jgi:hypothetical protein
VGSIALSKLKLATDGIRKLTSKLSTKNVSEVTKIEMVTQADAQLRSRI